MNYATVLLVVRMNCISSLELLKNILDIPEKSVITTTKYLSDKFGSIAPR